MRSLTNSHKNNQGGTSGNNYFDSKNPSVLHANADGGVPVTIESNTLPVVDHEAVKQGAALAHRKSRDLLRRVSQPSQSKVSETPSNPFTMAAAEFTRLKPLITRSLHMLYRCSRIVESRYPKVAAVQQQQFRLRLTPVAGNDRD